MTGWDWTWAASWCASFALGWVVGWSQKKNAYTRGWRDAMRQEHPPEHTTTTTSEVGE